MSCVVEINDLEELGALRLAWEALFRQTRQASFFQTLDWLETYWRHFGAGQRLRVLVVYSAGRPIGILPLCVRSEPTKLGRLRVLTYPLHDWGAFYGPLGPHPTATLLAGLRHVRETQRDWDLLELRWIDRDAVDHGRTSRVLAQVGCPAVSGAWKRLACLDLSGTWDDYEAAHSSKWRNNLRRNERRLAEHGPVEHLHHRPACAAAGDGDPRWDLYDACEQIARRSWQGASHDGTTLSHESVRPFLRAAHQRAAQRGMLDLHLIRVAGRPAAFAYNYWCDGRIQGLRLGYDPQFAACGLGAILYARAIRASFERGDAHYNLDSTSLAEKRIWLTHVETSYRATYYPPLDLRAQMLRAKRAVASWWEERGIAS